MINGEGCVIIIDNFWKRVCYICYYMYYMDKEMLVYFVQIENGVFEKLCNIILCNSYNYYYFKMYFDCIL